MSSRTTVRTYVEPTWVRTLREPSAPPAPRTPAAHAHPANVLMRAMQALLARKYPTR
ncbi:hypothetical protein [Aromatoleum bremense]|uniref:Uncharacterized protein n=1 Tax=Aromatoleum bremense TaxID=76115 RepID=A0ABX1NY54_9RHOO|nr:hypothetical protein [Aromatoleum bremense]NMG16975.1 hypothetical protein [Aromatoleum bremense]QTQ33233.1 Uncharacterized protein pbN1_32470 [Aromatoleum bremense]